MNDFNQMGQALGPKVPNWSESKFPPHIRLQGQYCRVEPLDIAVHSRDLYEAIQLDEDNLLWTYLRYGPFSSYAEYAEFLKGVSAGADPQFYAIIDHDSGKAIGVASYLRIAPAKGSIEVGHVCFSPILQRTRMATEAMYLMMKNAFTLGYRRYEWKCNALNEASRKAALRLGFTFEGVFRQEDVSKGRNRDTAWYSILDKEWPAQEQALSAWLASSNFNAHGEQLNALASFSQGAEATKL